MSAQRKKVTLTRGALTASAPDFGPRRGSGALPVSVGFAPDSGEGANPNETIKRAKTVMRYQILHSRGTITAEQAQAADRYLDLLELASGARPGGGETPWSERIRSAPSYGPSDIAADASLKLRDCHRALGIWGTQIMRLLVENDMGPSQIGALHSRSGEIATGWVYMVLQRAAEHFGLVR